MHSDNAPTPSVSVAPSRDVVLRTAACALGLTVILITVSLYSRHVGPLIQDAFGAGGSAYTLFAAIGYVGLAWAAFHRLRALAHRAWELAGVACSIAFSALMILGFGNRAASFALVGAALYALVYVWATLLLACCLLSLPSLRSCAVAVVGGVVARQLALPLYTLDVDAAIGMGAMGALMAVAVVGLTALAAPVFRIVESREALADLELTNPFSALRPSPRLYLCALLVSLAYNMGNALGVPGMSARRFVVVFVLLALLWALLVQRERQEDTLFSLVVLFVMAGLLVTPLVLERDSFVAHTLLFLGHSCMSILLWLVVYGIGRRNVAAAVPVLGQLFGADMLGRFLGGVAGELTIGSVAASQWQVQAVALGIALVFFAFIWLAFREFSFAETIRGVEAFESLRVDEGRGGSSAVWGTGAPDEPALLVGPVAQGSLAENTGDTDGAGVFSASIPRDNATAAAPGAAGPHAIEPVAGSSWAGSPGADAPEAALPRHHQPSSSQASNRLDPVERRCAELAKRAALTPREAEVLALLAHGRNARYLMETLHITRNTAKAHIAHVYTKLGVHSHQELLSLVEQRG